MKNTLLTKIVHSLLLFLFLNLNCRVVAAEQNSKNSLSIKEGNNNKEIILSLNSKYFKNMFMHVPEFSYSYNDDDIIGDFKLENLNILGIIDSKILFQVFYSYNYKIKEKHVVSSKKGTCTFKYQINPGLENELDKKLKFNISLFDKKCPELKWLDLTPISKHIKTFTMFYSLPSGNKNNIIYDFSNIVKSEAKSNNFSLNEVTIFNKLSNKSHSSKIILKDVRLTNSKLSYVFGYSDD